MNVKSDAYRLVKSLVELAPSKTQDKNQTTVNSFYFKDRHLHNPYYKFEQSVSELARQGYIKIVGHGEDIYWSVKAMCQYLYPKYDIEYSIKNLKKYLKNRKGKKNQIDEDKTDKPIDTSHLPFCVEEKGKGFLKFGKFESKISIGGTKTRHYRFLHYMLNPKLINAFKAIETIFEAIRLPKDESDQELAEYRGYTQGKLKKIQYCIKELQKEEKLQGKIKFELDSQETHMRAVIFY